MNDKKVLIEDIEKEIWESANELRGNLDPISYMHVILGILTLKYINDKYEHALKVLKNEGIDDPDELDLKSEDAFYVPEEAKWVNIVKFAGTHKIGFALDEAIEKISKANNDLKGVFISKYNDESIDKTKLGRVVQIFQNCNLHSFGEDILGRLYEYFLGKFFLKSGRDGGEFYTPKSIVKLITSFLKPSGKIYDPACGTGGMLIQSKEQIEKTGGKVTTISVYGQEYNTNTWKLGKLNLIIHGFNITDTTGKSVLGEKPADTFTDDQHKGETFDFIMANPPFNLKKWWVDSLKGDPRWHKYGEPPKENANYAWLEHILYKLTPFGKAGVVLANGSLTSTTKQELEIRKKIIEDNKISCIVSLSDKLFYTTTISACIWFFDNDKKNKNILFIDANDFGTLVEGNKSKKEITEENIEKLEEIYNDFLKGKEINIPGIAKSIEFEKIKNNDFSLLPGAYIDSVIKDKENPEILKKELKQNIDELKKILEEEKSIEKELYEAIKKIEDL